MVNDPDHRGEERDGPYAAWARVLAPTPHKRMEGDPLAQVRHDVRCRMRPRGPQIGQDRSDVRQRPPGRVLRQRETRTEALQQQGTSVEVAVQQPYDVGRVGPRGERGGFAGGDSVIRRQLEHN
jgi:hypothetical protein